MRSANYILGFCLALLGLALLPLTGCGGAECGDGTIDQDGECVLEADPIECGQNTTLEDGVCVAADAISCGDDTELDPNENRCFVTEEACGDNTAFSSEEDRCVPTSEVCTEGTSFDDDSGLCIADAECSDDQVLLDGYCVTSAEALAEDADVHADGNTNYAFGGEPVDLPSKSAGEQSIFTGTIGEPTDLNDDDVADQVIDYFRFEGDAGDWFEISVRSAGIPSPAFRVYSEEAEEFSLYRESSTSTSRDKVRQVVLPEDGTYFIAVLPEAALSDSDHLVGGADWDYVGTIEQLDAPDATAHTFGDANVEGTIGSLTENFVHSDEFEFGKSVQLNWVSAPSSAEPVITAWASPTEFIGEFTGSTVNLDIPESDDVYFIFDWESMDGATGLDFEVSGRELVNLAPEEETTVAISASAGDVFDITQDNTSSASVDLIVADADDDENILIDRSLSRSDRARFINVPEGDYIVTFTNNGEDEVSDFSASVLRDEPEVIDDFTATQDGEANEYIDGDHDYYLFEVDETTAYRTELTHTSGSGYARVYIYEPNEDRVAQTTSAATSGSPNRSVSHEFQADTTYVVAVGNEDTYYTSDFEYELDFTEIDTVSDGESTDPIDVTAEAGDVFEAWQTNSGGDEVDLTITHDGGDVLYDGPAADGELIQELDVDAGDYTVVFTNNSGNPLFGFDSDAVALTPIEATTFTADADAPVELSQSNDDSATVDIIVTAPSGDIAHSESLSTSGTLSFTATETGEYSVSYFRSGEDSADQAVDNLEVTVDVGVSFVADSVVALNGDVIEITQENPDDLAVLASIVDSNGDEVYSETLGTGSTDLFRYTGLEAGDYDVVFSYVGDLVEEDFAANVDLSEPTVVTDFTEEFAGTSHEPFYRSQAYYLVEVDETTTFEMELERTDGVGWGYLYVYGLGDDQIVKSSDYAATNPMTMDFEFEADTTYIIRVGGDSTSSSVWDLDFFLRFTEL